MRRLAILALSVLACGCGVKRTDPVRQYIRLAVALGERDATSLDYYYGPEDWVQDVRAQPPSLAEIAAQSQALRDSLPSTEEPLRRQLLAVSTRARQLAGARLRFDEEAGALFGLTSIRFPDASTLEEARAEIARLLPGTGPLSARLDQMERRWTVPPDRYPAVLTRAVQECRSRGAVGIPLPATEGVSFEWVSNQPWNAFSWYRGKLQSRVKWNADFPVTVDRALQLACHETYPGHHTHNVFLEGVGSSMLTVQPAFSPQAFLSEALASNAGDLAFTPDEREQFERDVLFPLAGLDPAQEHPAFQVSRALEQLELGESAIAREFLDGRLEFLRAAQELERQTLMAHPEATLKYMNIYRTYLLGYTVGKSMVRDCLGKVRREGRWQMVRRLLRGTETLASCSGE